MKPKSVKPKQSLNQTVSLTLLLTALSSGTAPAFADSLSKADALSKSNPKTLNPTSQVASSASEATPVFADSAAALLSQEPKAGHPDAAIAMAQTAEALPAAQSTPSIPTLIRSATPAPVLVAEAVNANPMGQVNNVFELRDVSPDAWAYAALRDLVNRYDCIKGYPDSTFRGNRALSRYEFAAALNACMQVMEQTLAEIGDRFATQDDLEALRRLTQEFEAELATLSTQVDGLEERVQFLEDNQFSTTTKLFGQTTIGIQGRSQGSFNLAGNRFEDPDTNLNVITSTNLSLFTQFSPRSLLLTTLNAGDGNTTRFIDSLGNYVSLAYEGDTNNRLQLADLNYRHLIGNNLAVMVGPKGISPVNVFRGTNRIENEGSGSLSRFAQRNPIIAIGNGSGGVGVDWQINPTFSLQGVYASQLPNDATNGGLFGGSNNTTTLGFQLVASPSSDIDVSLQYINSYSPYGRLLTGVGDDQLIIGNSSPVFNLRAPMKTDAFGLGAEWRLSDSITFGGWAGYTVSDYIVASGTIETFNWMTFLNLPDLGGEGNLMGLYFGQPPRISYSSMNGTAAGGQARNVPSFLYEGDLLNAGPGGQQGATYHLEAFYRWQLTNNISITPGVIWIISPFHNGINDDILIGAVRTTFSF